MAIGFFLVLLLGTLLVLTVCLALLYDSTSNARKSAAAAAADDDDFETEHDMGVSDNTTDDDQYLTLMLRHGDNISEELADYVRRAQEAAKTNSSEDYQRFVELLRKLYDEYEETVLPLDETSPLSWIVDESSDSMMLGDEPVADERTASHGSPLDALLERGRKLLAKYRKLANRFHDKKRDIEQLKAQMKQLDNEKQGLDLTNDTLIAQLEQSKIKVEKLQESYDEASRKMSELNRKYEQQTDELRVDREKLQKLENECEKRSTELQEAIDQKNTSGQQIDRLSQNLREHNETEESLRQEIDRRSDEFVGKTRAQEESCNRLRDDLTRSIAENRTDADAVRKQLLEAENRLAADTNKHHAEMDKLQEQFLASQQDLQAATNQLAASKEKAKFEEDRAAGLGTEVTRLKTLLANTVKHFNQKVESVDDAGKLLDALKDQCDLYQRSLTDEKDTLSKTQDRLHELESQVTEAERKLLETQKQLDAKTLAVESEHSQFVAYKERYNAATVDNARTALIAEVAKVRKDYTDCMVNLSNAEGKAILTNVEITKLREQLETGKLSG